MITRRGFLVGSAASAAVTATAGVPGGKKGVGSAASAAVTATAGRVHLLRANIREAE